MGKYQHLLKILRAIALEHTGVEHPDLATMARELGRVVHQDASALATRLADLRRRRHGFERWQLAERNKPPVSVLVLAWPPNHATPVHDHSGRWGLEMSLVGALEVQTYDRADSGELSLYGRHWLGPGDGFWFESDCAQAYRCRNLSRHDTALSLHVYGGELAGHVIGTQAEPAGRWMAPPRRNAIAGRLSG
ncbi:MULTISPECIES: cysteine dioxygenase [Rhodanobacter]|uniref:cysteine dioxygenase n=1 Tax=Rhodanobacter TaxID=75309 RepID=UPI0003FE9139|nr:MULTISPECIES: cysteine dioxygenase family protein [Rhodanobacter]TAN18376.1 MAG: cysteine dioxygenase [Rhodanobacter sp.]UJJ54702.1 cysteine dioxygenase family protein [Rhodanobacter thiooxydans]